jgi:hypothetical protein
MSLNAAALRLLAEKGLTAADIVELAEVLEVRRDPTAAARMRRHRAKKAGKGEDTVTVTRNVTPVTADAPPNDIYSNPPRNPSEPNGSEPPFAEKVVSEWNAGPGSRGARKAQKLDAARRKQLAARIREHGEDGVLAAIRGTAASPFHCGENDTAAYLASIGDKPWMRGRENEIAPPVRNGTGPPRPIGQLAAGIAGSLTAH